MGPHISTITHPETCHQIARNYFDFLYIIGRGGFGKVWKVQLKKTTKFYALKEMSKLKIIDKKSEHSIISERDLLSSMNHSFIVNMSYAFQDHENLYLVMDLLTGGDLRYQLFKYKTFTEEITRFFIACLILGLEYIHSKKIIHRDIKPENLVCDKEGYVRITDFGVAKVYQNNNALETSGTPGYMAPEVLFGQNHSYQVDYFAIGVIGYEFMFGLRPYLGRCRKDIRDLVLNKQVQIKEPDILPDWSIPAADFINKLLLRKPSQRLGYNGINELKNHPWMKPIDWDQLLKHKISSPFIPETADNFDKKYCEAQEKIGDETFRRYQEYVKNPEYSELFKKYNFIPNITLIKETKKKKKRLQTMNTSSSIKLSKGTSTKASFNESLSSLLKVDSYKITKPHSHQHNHTYSNNHNYTIYNSKSNEKRKNRTKTANTSSVLLGKSISMKSINKAMRKTISVMYSNNNIQHSHHNKKNNNSKNICKASHIQLSDNNTYTSKRHKDKPLSPYKTVNNAKSQELSQSKSQTRKHKDRESTKTKDSLSRNSISKKTKSLYTIKYSNNLPLLSFASLSPIYNHDHNTIIFNKQNMIINNKQISKKNHKIHKNVFKQPQKILAKPQYETIQIFHQGITSQKNKRHSKYYSPLLIGNSRNGS